MKSAFVQPEERESIRATAKSSKWRLGIGKALAWIILSILFATQVYPLLWLLLYSFKSDGEILDGNFLALPQTMQWNNYTMAFRNGDYLTALFNSILVTGTTLIATILLSAMVSYAITRFRFRYGNALLVFFLIGIMIPHQSILLPLLLILKRAGILNTHLALILPYIGFAIPVAIFILATFFRSIPHEIEESAIVDGASIMRLFTSIIIPISTPPITTVTILTFVAVWNEYIMAATFISAKALKTLPFGVFSFVGQYSTNYGAMGAFLVLAALPVMLFYFLMAQKITKGMVAGAVKG
jgi:raffinose/stachyose/melibiose transport system permease protein